MTRRSNVYVGATVVTLVVLLTAVQVMLQTKTTRRGPGRRVPGGPVVAEASCRITGFSDRLLVSPSIPAITSGSFIVARRRSTRILAP